LKEAQRFVEENAALAVDMTCNRSIPLHRPKIIEPGRDGSFGPKLPLRYSHNDR
jgi:hypothetical protein